MGKEQSGLSTIGLCRWVKNKVDLVPLAGENEYGKNGLSTISLRRLVKGKMDLVPLAGEDELRTW